MKTILILLSLGGIAGTMFAVRQLESGSSGRLGRESTTNATRNTVLAGSAGPPAILPSSGATAPSAEALKQEADAARLAKSALKAWRQGDIDGAYRLYRQSIETMENPLLRLEMISMLDRAKRTTAALQEYDALFDTPSIGGSYEKSASVLGRYADLCEAAGRHDEAISLYRRILASFRPSPGVTPPPPSTDVHDFETAKATAKIIEAWEHSGHADHKKALALCLEAVAIKPDFAQAYLHVGLAYRNLRKNAESESAYRKAYALGDATVKTSLADLRPDLFLHRAASPR